MTLELICERCTSGRPLLRYLHPANPCWFRTTSDRIWEQGADLYLCVGFLSRKVTEASCAPVHQIVVAGGVNSMTL